MDTEIKTLQELMKKVPTGNWFSHVGIRKSGGGENGYFYFDAHKKENLELIINYLSEQLMYLEAREKLK